MISGVKDVVPVGDCVFAVGTYYSINSVFGPIYGQTGPSGSPLVLRNDYHEVLAKVPANWMGASDCTRLACPRLRPIQRVRCRGQLQHG